MIETLLALVPTYGLWLIVASTLLRTIVEPGDEWVALVHEPDT